MVTQPGTSIDEIIELSLFNIRRQRAKVRSTLQGGHRVLEARILDQMQHNHEILRTNRSLYLSQEVTYADTAKHS